MISEGTLSAGDIVTALTVRLTDRPGSAALGEQEAAHQASLEALYALNSRVFSAATGIAMHASEPIYRLVATSGTSLDEELQQEPNRNTTRGVTRSVYQVGAHIVFEPPVSFCSCAAFRFQVVNRQVLRGCKHVLALQLALRGDGVPDASSSSQLDGLTMYPQPPPRCSRIRERLITMPDFIALMTANLQM